LIDRPDIQNQNRRGGEPENGEKPQLAAFQSLPDLAAQKQKIKEKFMEKRKRKMVIMISAAGLW
jgi:hypothetical protein